MMTKRKIVAVSSLLTAAVTVLGTVAGSPPTPTIWGSRYTAA